MFHILKAMKMREAYVRNFYFHLWEAFESFGVFKNVPQWLSRSNKNLVEKGNFLKGQKSQEKDNLRIDSNIAYKFYEMGFVRH